MKTKMEVKVAILGDKQADFCWGSTKPQEP